MPLRYRPRRIHACVTRAEFHAQHDVFLTAVERAQWVPEDYFREARIEEIFQNPSAPLELDLGCGDGSFFVELAKRHPGHNFLATERLLGRVEKVAKKIVRGRLNNARILRLESHYVLRWLLPPNCASIIYILHPDPWPKRVHQDRRLIQGEFMEAVHRVLVDGGEMRVKTDDKPYYQWMEKVFAACPQFERLDWVEPEDWPKTDFELDFVAKGLPIYSARLRKR
jgi:tRNA (guanine-N7-)-methyltransferase